MSEVKKMTSDKFYRLKRGCLAQAGRRGYPQEGDDFFSFVLERLSRGEEKIHMRTAFVDYMRVTYGDSRLKTGKARARAKARHESIDNHYDLALPPVELMIEPSAILSNNLTPRKRMILILTAEWGFSQKEVAHVLGVSDPVVSTELSSIRKSIG